MMETPAIATTSYVQALGAANMQPPGLLSGLQLGQPFQQQQWAPDNGELHRRFNQIMANQTTSVPEKKEPIMADFNTRLVKVFIVDPNLNLPLESRLVYRGDEKLTDLTDQELFFEIDINGLLQKHNEIRVKTEDKKANKDKPIYLEPARVRDLKMQVIVLAQF